MEGNFFNNRGLYTQAIASYLQAIAYASTAPYAEFALASVYFSLGENAAALERYSAAESRLAELSRDNLDLRFRIHYNTGIIFFQSGDYEAALGAFRHALEIDGGRIEAKRNLELSLLMMDRALAAQTSDLNTPGETGEEAAVARSALFEYMRQMEREQWKNREWESTSDRYSGLDH